MSKAIYTLKLTLLKDQFPDLTWHKKQKLNTMTFFILFVYLESWFRSSSLFTAASDGLKRRQRLLKFRNIHKKLVNEGLTSTPYLVPYPGDDFGVSIQQQHIIWIIKNKFAEKILILPIDNLQIRSSETSFAHY